MLLQLLPRESPEFKRMMGKMFLTAATGETAAPGDASPSERTSEDFMDDGEDG